MSAFSGALDGEPSSEIMSANALTKVGTAQRSNLKKRQFGI
jgi:hypothetical protein